MAPEILAMPPSGYGKEVDWWSLECLIFEMITGFPPFHGGSPQEVFENIKNWKTLLPRLIDHVRDVLSVDFIDLVLGFLCEADKRLGRDVEVIKRHPFFKAIDWDNLRNSQPLFVPKLQNECDVSYFEYPNDPLTSPLTLNTSFRRYYNSCLLKHKDPLPNPLQCQLQRLHRSHSLDASELHAHNVPAWVTPYKRNNKQFKCPAGGNTTSRVKPLHFVTPPQCSTDTPPSDKQILGFTFQRKQTSRVVQLDKQALPTFKLTEASEEKGWREEDGE